MDSKVQFEYRCSICGESNKFSLEMARNAFARLHALQHELRRTAFEAGLTSNHDDFILTEFDKEFLRDAGIPL